MRPFKTGDKVACIVGHYKSYKPGSTASVLDVLESRQLIKLLNPLNDYGWSWYIAENFTLVEPVKKIREKEAETMAATRAKYFGTKFNPGTASFPNLDTEKMTALRDTKSEALRDVRENIAEGEEWVILQTVAFVQHAPPKPILAEVKVTDCH